MSGRIVTVSYTELDASGGVPKFNRDLHSAFPDRECVHFSWWDHPFHPELDEQGNLPEWYKARELNQYLSSRGMLRRDDVIIADGFWADGLESYPFAVSHSHGIWSHLTKDDVELGKKPDMPLHHAYQVAFRRRWVDMGKPLTAVSQFIADQLMLQWGWEAHVINNGVDVDLFKPMEKSNLYGLKRPFVIHGVNDRSNKNKGWEHIEFLKTRFENQENPWTIMSLDEAYLQWAMRSDHPWEKHEILAQADLVVHPSAYEGNSMFIAEALSCNVPVVGYNVGYLYAVDAHCEDGFVGAVLDRNGRNPASFAFACGAVVGRIQDHPDDHGYIPRKMALRDLSIESFRSEWRRYVSWLETR
ncbi:MAG: glycosyltransferase [Thermomicrobiales bacterium]